MPATKEDRLIDLELSAVLFGEFGSILVRQSKFVNLLSKRI